MADDRGDLQALKRMIEIGQAQAAALGIPSLVDLLERAGQSLASHAARTAAPRIPRGPALSIPRGDPPRD